MGGLRLTGVGKGGSGGGGAARVTVPHLGLQPKGGLSPGDERGGDQEREGRVMVGGGGCGKRGKCGGRGGAARDAISTLFDQGHPAKFFASS